MLKQIKNFLIMTLSITIMAIGVYYFKFPNNFTFGGVTGAAVVFAKITPLSASMFSTIVNMLLLVVGFFFLGKGFAIKTTYATILLSVELLVLEKLDPLTHPLSNEPMLEHFCHRSSCNRICTAFLCRGFKWRNRCHRHDCKKICTCRKYRHGFISHRPRHDYHRLLCI